MGLDSNEHIGETPIEIDVFNPEFAMLFDGGFGDCLGNDLYSQISPNIYSYNLNYVAYNRRNLYGSVSEVFFPNSMVPKCLTDVLDANPGCVLKLTLSDNVLSVHVEQLLDAADLEMEDVSSKDFGDNDKIVIGLPNNQFPTVSQFDLAKWSPTRKSDN